MFRILDGDYYVHANLGSDTNTGGINDPFKTIGKASVVSSGIDKIVARGYFEEGISAISRTLVGDGYCELNGSGGVVTGSSNVNLENVIIKDFSVAYTGLARSFLNVMFVDCSVQGQAINCIHKNVVFKSVVVGTASNSGFDSQGAVYNGCTFIDCSGSRFTLGIVKNCIFQSGTGDISTFNSVFSDYNVFEIGVTRSGNDLSAYKLLNPLDDDNSIEVADAGLSDILDGDYTIKVGSASVGIGEGGIDCGAYLKSYQTDGLNTDFDGATGSGTKDANVSIDASGHISLSSGSIGTITSDVIDLVANGLTKPLRKVHIFGEENHVDGSVFDESNKRDYVYEMRWGATAPDVLLASFKKFFRRKNLSVDANDNGNADLAYDDNNNFALNANFVQIRITINQT